MTWFRRGSDGTSPPPGPGRDDAVDLTPIGRMAAWQVRAAAVDLIIAAALEQHANKRYVPVDVLFDIRLALGLVEVLRGGGDCPKCGREILISAQGRCRWRDCPASARRDA